MTLDLRRFHLINYNAQYYQSLPQIPLRRCIGPTWQGAIAAPDLWWLGNELPRR